MKNTKKVTKDCHPWLLKSDMNVIGDTSQRDKLIL